MIDKLFVWMKVKNICHKNIYSDGVIDDRFGYGSLNEVKPFNRPVKASGLGDTALYFTTSSPAV